MGLKEFFFGKKDLRRMEQNINSAIMRGTAVYGDNNAAANVEDGYLTSADNFSIVRRIARTAAMIPLNVYKVKDENALKEYDFHSKQHNYTTQSLLKKQVLKTKALEMVKESHPLQKILDKPNELYSKNEFREGAYIFRLLTGNTYIHAPLLELGVNAGKPVELWLLPSQYTRPLVTQSWPHSITGYELDLNGRLTLNKEEVIHIRYFNPAFSYQGDELVGLSPLRAGSKILTRADAETDYSVSAFQNSGADGIVTREDANDLDAAAFGQMKNAFYAEASGRGNVKKKLFTQGKWDFVQIGLSPVDMNVLQSEVRTFKKLCNLYGVSDILFNNSDASTESNVEEMVKALYTNAALPEVYALRDALNAYLTPKFQDGNKYYIDCDITGISELQDDMKEMAEIYSTLPIMIPNLIMESFGYGKAEDPNMDKVYVKTGYTDLESIQSIGDIEPVTENGK